MDALLFKQSQIRSYTFAGEPVPCISQKTHFAVYCTSLVSLRLIIIHRAFSFAFEISHFVGNPSHTVCTVRTDAESKFPLLTQCRYVLYSAGTFSCTVFHNIYYCA